MDRDAPHPNREELLLAADGELSAQQTKKLQRHLSTCWQCRAQMRELEAAIESFVRLHRETLDPYVPRPEGPRALLTARLQTLAASSAGTRWNWISLSNRSASLASLLSAFIALILGVLIILPRHRADFLRAAVLIPDARLTPGVAGLTGRDQVCNESAPNNKMVPSTVQQSVFAVYGISNPDPRAYEIDYLISPALGGADDIRNLWPQPKSAAVWNSRVKDALEDRLRSLVCSGELDLTTAQRDISRNWIAAYKRYFDTDRPIENAR